MFQKLHLFLSLGEGQETATLLGPLEIANLSRWLALSKGPNRVGISLPSSEEGTRCSFRNVAFSSNWNSGWWTKSRNPVTQSVMHCHPDLLDYTSTANYPLCRRRLSEFTVHWALKKPSEITTYQEGRKETVKIFLHFHFGYAIIETSLNSAV
jgi:hypothetical protein